MKTMRKIICLIFIICSSSLSMIMAQDTVEKSFIGKWYNYLHYDVDNAYTNIAENGIDTRWFEFKENNEFVRFNCTDICGCMGATYYGTVKWTNDSIVVVQYNHKTRMTEKWDLKKSKFNKKQEFKIIRHNATTLIIEPLNEVH